LITDAKQRVVINTKASPHHSFPGRNQPERIVCSEPSPDVAQALSTALSVSLEAAKAGVGSAGASLGFSSAASVAQLGERLATIQLLRDELSDLCRSYANGAVSTTTYTVRLSRLDQKMVTLLMGEMTAGAFGRQLATLGGASQSATGRVGSPQEVEQARLDVESQQKEVDKKEDKLVAAKTDAERESAQVELDTENAELARRNNVLLALLRRTASSFAQASTGSGPGQIAGMPSESTRASLVSLQRNFLDEDDLGTLLAACLSSMDAVFTDFSDTEDKLGLDSLQFEVEDLQEKRTVALRQETQSLAAADGLEVQFGSLNHRIETLRDALRAPDGDPDTFSAIQKEINKLEAERVGLVQKQSAAERAAEQADIEIQNISDQIDQKLVERNERTSRAGLTKLGIWCDNNMQVLNQSIEKRFSTSAELRKREIQDETAVMRSRIETCGKILAGPDLDKLPAELKQACATLIAGS